MHIVTKSLDKESLGSGNRTGCGLGVIEVEECVRCAMDYERG